MIFSVFNFDISYKDIVFSRAAITIRFCFVSYSAVDTWMIYSVWYQIYLDVREQSQSCKYAIWSLSNLDMVHKFSFVEHRQYMYVKYEIFHSSHLFTRWFFTI